MEKITHKLGKLSPKKDARTLKFFITWGMIKRMTWRFYFAYVDEAYAVLSAKDWINNGKSPADFDLAALRADLSGIDSAT